MRSLLKNIASALLISFASVLLLSGCARITIKDSRWCGDLGKFGAECAWTLSDRKQSFKKEEWDRVRLGMVCSEAQSFGDLKTAILQFCEKNPSMCLFVSDDLKKTKDTLDRIQKLGVIEGGN